MNKCKECPFQYIDYRGNWKCRRNNKVVNAYGCEEELPKLELVAEGKIIKLIIEARENDMKILHHRQFNDFKFNSRGKLILTTNKNIKIYVEIVDE